MTTTNRFLRFLAVIFGAVTPLMAQTGSAHKAAAARTSQWRAIAISSGRSHTLKLRGDGTVWTWGYNGFGQLGDGTFVTRLTPVQVSGLTGVVAVAGGGDHSLALKSDGTVWSWGYGVSGQLGIGIATSNQQTPVQVPALNGVVAIAAGFEHSVALKSDGTVWAWGYNAYGQLGDGTITQRPSPVLSIGLTGGGGASAVSAAGHHSMVLKTDGTVWAFGWNIYGLIGDGGAAADRRTPVQVSGLTGVVAIAAGFYHSMALRSDGMVWAWGQDYYGALGDGLETDRSIPVQTRGLTGVVAIAAGEWHSMALRGDGTVWGWGRNDYGQVGDGSITPVPGAIQKSTPSQVSGLTAVVAISGGGQQNAAQKSDGTVWTWGHNVFGEIGDGTTTQRITPVPVGGLVLAGFTGIAAGSRHSLALKSDGTVWAWGQNDMGQIGDGTTTQRQAAVQVRGLTLVTAISAGDKFSVALKGDGTVWAWGSGSEGQLGDGTTAQQKLTPGLVSGLAGVVAISSGHEHSLALKGDGTVWAWGYNGGGQIGDGTNGQRAAPVQISGLTGVVSIAAGWEDSLALKGDGTVWGWGSNYHKELGDGTSTAHTTPIAVGGFTGVLAIAAGENDSLALKSDGTVWGLGRDDWSQFGDGVITGSGMVERAVPVQTSGLSGLVAISAGFVHGLGLKSDGTVWKWGSDSFGSNVAANPTAVQVSGLSGMVAIAGGEWHSLALKSDGTIWSWGRNAEGQLGDGTTTDHLAAALSQSTAAAHSPGVVSISPANSTGANQSYVFQFADTFGAVDLTVVNVLINNYLDGRRGCYVAYAQQSNALYLVNDAGDAGGPYAGVLVLNGSGSIGNSQCTISGVGSSAVVSGNTLALTLNMSFTAAFGGNRVVYAAARDTALVNTGWQTMGVHGVPGLAATYPNPVSMSPASGSTGNPVLTFTYQDALSADSLQTAWVLINTAIDGRNACYVAYHRPSNQIYLYPDSGDGSLATHVALTGTNTLSNSQCTVSSQGSSVTTSGAVMTVNLNISFTAAFRGPKGVWMAVQTMTAQTSAWEALGAWLAP